MIMFTCVVTWFLVKTAPACSFHGEIVALADENEILLDGLEY